MHTLTYLLLSTGLDPNAPTTTARANVGSLAKTRPGEAIGEVGARALTEGRAAAWPWLLVGLMVLGIAVLFARSSRLKYLGLGVAAFALAMVFVFRTELLGNLLRGFTDTLFGG